MTPWTKGNLFDKLNNSHLEKLSNELMILTEIQIIKVKLLFAHTAGNLCLSGAYMCITAHESDLV